MRALLEVVMGLRLNFDDATTVEFETTEGDEIQLMAPGDPYFDFFREHAHGPVSVFGFRGRSAGTIPLISSGERPMPVSGTASSVRWQSFSSVTATRPPVAVYLIALEIRLSSSWLRRTPSPRCSRSVARHGLIDD